MCNEWMLGMCMRWIFVIFVHDKMREHIYAFMLLLLLLLLVQYMKQFRLDARACV